MKITIDLELCAGTAQCMDTAPDVFDVSADGRASVRTDVSEPVDERLVHRAAANCPLGAISIEQATDSQHAGDTVSAGGRPRRGTDKRERP
jgi:ferredoxin